MRRMPVRFKGQLAWLVPFYGRDKIRRSRDGAQRVPLVFILTKLFPQFVLGSCQNAFSDGWQMFPGTVQIKIQH